MSSPRKRAMSFLAALSVAIPCLALAQGDKEKAEPELKGEEVIQLIKKDSLQGWKTPSDRWSISEGVIVGDTGKVALDAPEWLYTKQRFSDFTFTCEVRLTGDDKANSGIYFRANPIPFKWRKHSYEAASGYEFDIVPGKHCGSLGDWYARPKLRVFAERELVDRLWRKSDWNRLTIRARGNHLEYWLNGEKVVDYHDKDPKGSREGFIGLQIHDRAVMKVEMRNARVAPVD
ncbi:3-keto-disaccharide hydrolase [Haloferula sp.]|uniref:3-keto-disaccharide hydrolase n=1 Tax=Haloferula sp. TaxID=2497595 RepID=UPI00329B3F5C